MGYPFRTRLTQAPVGDVSVVQMKDIDERGLLCLDDAMRVSLPEPKARHWLREGDILFRSRGRSNKAALVAAQLPKTVLAAPLLLIRPTGVDSRYLLWFLNCPRAQEQLAGMARGTAVQMISAGSLRSLEVLLPALDRQRQIAEADYLVRTEHELMTQIASKRRWVTNDLLLRAAGTTG